MTAALRAKIEAMLEVERAAVAIGLAQITRDPALTRAEIRAELLRQMLAMLPCDQPPPPSGEKTR